MDLLDAQASEIRSFLGPTPLGGPLRPSSSSHRAHGGHSSRSAPLGDNSAHSPPIASSPPGVSGNSPTTSSLGPGSVKRRATEEDADSSSTNKHQQQRSKRNRYISIACNECKRRKIKCNGETPCQRCGHLNLQCLYAPNCCSNSVKDSEEFRQIAEQVNALQQQVNELTDSMNTLRQETVRLAPIQPTLPLTPGTVTTPLPPASAIPALPRPLPPFRVPQTFGGPTSIAFTVDCAKNTLHRLGYPAPVDSAEDGALLPEPTQQMHPATPTSTHQRPLDPIWEFNKDEMARLCRFYEEEIGLMYPIVSIESVLAHSVALVSWMDEARQNGQYGQDDPILVEPKTMMVKIILCCALVVEEHGNSARADQLYSSIQPIVDKKLMSEPANAQEIPYLALCAGYRFLSNDEILAWRTMGHVARLCFELGLHRREGLAKIPDPRNRRDALYTFWSTYMLDRRWSFSTGLPFVCQDDKIDPKLPYPDNNPYLIAMISHARLAAKVWKVVDYFEPAVIRELKYSDFDDLDREVLAWYASIPEELKLDSIERISPPNPSAGTKAYDLGRLRIWMRLRLLQIRTWLYTPVLHSAISIEDNKSLAHQAVAVAKETIRSLAHLNNTTDLYRRLQVFYHQFLTSAISVLFLASTHAPLEFSATCRIEFYMALELIKGLSARSWISQRLWRTVQSLKAYAQRVGMDDLRHSGDLSSSAQMSGLSNGGSNSQASTPGTGPAYGVGGMGGRLESRGVLRPTSTPPVQPSHRGTDDHSNGLRLQSEMQRVFEGYINGGPSGAVSPAASGDMMPSQAGLPNVLSPDGSFMGDMDALNGSVYEQMKDMF